jgi:hypothetical protein
VCTLAVSAWSLSVRYIAAAGGAVASAGEKPEKSKNAFTLRVALRQEQKALIFRKIAKPARRSD